MRLNKSEVKGARENFLPVNRETWKDRAGIASISLSCRVTHTDHPSFGHAIISRWLEKMGFRIGIVAQPDWRSTEDFARMGRPRLGVMVTAGNLDSMLNHYTASGKKRKSDPYSPGGRSGMRPDRATIVYCNRIRELWKDIPLVIGGIEASLRRMAHYDCWADDVRRSILTDSRADLLVFGMGELPVTEIARYLSEGRDPGDIRDVPGTCWKTHDPSNAADAVVLPSFEEVRADKKVFAKAFKTFYLEQNHARGNRLIQDRGHGMSSRTGLRPMTVKDGQGLQPAVHEGFTSRLRCCRWRPRA